MGTACLLSTAASAQWLWIDQGGRKVYSDRAPPVEVLEKNILKRPGDRHATTDVTDGAAIAAPAASAPRPGGINKELADKKKKTEEAELAKRKAEEERILKAKAESCARAKQAKAGFDSGMRMARINDKGEREIMDEAARAAELNRIQSVIDSDCQ